MIVLCGNCDNVQEIGIQDVNEDENGTYTVCDSCGGSFDVDYEKDILYSIDYLNSLSRGELLIISKEHGYTGVSSYDKKSLLEILSNVAK